MITSTETQRVASVKAHLIYSCSLLVDTVTEHAYVDMVGKIPTEYKVVLARDEAIGRKALKALAEDFDVKSVFAQTSIPTERPVRAIHVQARVGLWLTLESGMCDVCAKMNAHKYSWVGQGKTFTGTFCDQHRNAGLGDVRAA